jgi:hypothetical protein
MVNKGYVYVFGLPPNSAPADIALSAAAVAENAGANAVVGALSVTDANAGQVHSLMLVAGAGDADNAAFNLNGNQLRLSASADFETKNSYSLRLRATDNGTPALSYEEAFTVSITNVNEPPSFTIGPNVQVAAIAAAQTVPGFIPVFHDGDSTVTQALTFNVSVTAGAGLFSTAPAINSGGTLTYTPNGTAGTATVSVTLTDDAGIGGPALTTAAQSFTITTLPLPDLQLAQITLQPGGAAAMNFRGIPLQSYRIQRSTDLINWTTLSTQNAAADGALPYLDSTPPAGRAQYRAVTP